MEVIAIVLVLGSATLHPIRDLTLRRAGPPELAYLGVALVWIAVSLAHCVANGESLRLPEQVWPLALVSAAGLIVYYWGTLSALRSGDLSVYYPIIRLAPIFMVIYLWLFEGRLYPWVTLAGIVITIVAGSVLQTSGRRLLPRPRATLWALAAAIGSAAYGLADARSMQLVKPEVLLFWIYLLVSGGLAALAGFNLRAQAASVRFERRNLFRILLAALSSYLSYYLILLAYARNADPAVVNVVRQFATPVAVFVAIVWYREHLRLSQWVSVTVLTAGIALVASTG